MGTWDWDQAYFVRVIVQHNLGSWIRRNEMAERNLREGRYAWVRAHSKVVLQWTEADRASRYPQNTPKMPSKSINRWLWYLNLSYNIWKKDETQWTETDQNEKWQNNLQMSPQIGAYSMRDKKSAVKRQSCKLVIKQRSDTPVFWQTIHFLPTSCW